MQRDEKSVNYSTLSSNIGRSLPSTSQCSNSSDEKRSRQESTRIFEFPIRIDLSIDHEPLSVQILEQEKLLDFGLINLYNKDEQCLFFYFRKQKLLLKQTKNYKGQTLSINHQASSQLRWHQQRLSTNQPGKLSNHTTSLLHNRRAMSFSYAT